MKRAYFDAKELHLSGAIQAANAYLKVFELGKGAKGPTLWGFKAAGHLTKSAIREVSVTSLPCTEVPLKNNRDDVVSNYLRLIAHTTAVTEDRMKQSFLKILALLAEQGDVETHAIITAFNKTLKVNDLGGNEFSSLVATSTTDD